MSALKKYLFWSLIPVIVLFCALNGFFRPDPENWYLLGVFFVIGLSLALALVGCLYFFTTKRQETHVIGIERQLLSICLFVSLLLPLVDLLGVSKTIHIWMYGSEAKPAGFGYFFLLTRKVFVFVQLVVVVLFVRTFLPKKEQVINDSST